MSAREIQAARALREALNRSEALSAQRMGEQADALFDGGEWSAEFHHGISDQIVSQIEREVADRFDMTAEELSLAFDRWCYETEGRTIDAAREVQMRHIARCAIERHLGDIAGEGSLYDCAFTLAHDALRARGYTDEACSRIASAAAREVAP